MNAAERIQAAIEKLESLRASSTPGPWDAPKELLGLPSKTVFGCAPGRTHAAYVAVAHDGELIVTLHRTIDAQLAILRGELDFIRDESGPLFEFEPGTDVLALADAILGES